MRGYSRWSGDDHRQEGPEVHLEQLDLAQAATVLDGRLQAAAKAQVPYADFLADLLSAEAAARKERHQGADHRRVRHLAVQPEGTVALFSLVRARYE